jgi:hypothetical protein
MLTDEQVAQKAIEEYHNVIERIKNAEGFLKSKEFPMGTYVIKKGTSMLDSLFGTGEGQVGKIVGWDFEYEYYRVFYSQQNPYIGTREDTIELYEGEAPDSVKNMDAYQIKNLLVRL